MPDPIARSFACLIERVETLEAELRQLRGEAAGRQVKCDLGFVNSMGGVFATNSAVVLGTENAL